MYMDLHREPAKPSVLEQAAHTLAGSLALGTLIMSVWGCLWLAFGGQ